MLQSLHLTDKDIDIQLKASGNSGDNICCNKASIELVARLLLLFLEQHMELKESSHLVVPDCGFLFIFQLSIRYTTAESLVQNEIANFEHLPPNVL